jgi:hypothetical protein
MLCLSLIVKAKKLIRVANHKSRNKYASDSDSENNDAEDARNPSDINGSYDQILHLLQKEAEELANGSAYGTSLYFKLLTIAFMLLYRSFCDDQW